MHDYQFSEIRTPMFESYDLFSRSVGDTSDIVSKEMYVFEDKGNRQLALKPEGTAPIVRAYVENKLFGPEFPKPFKVYYLSPMFRYERPQSGRSRQFHQLGVEVIGSTNPAVDVETMALAWDLLQEINTTMHTVLLVIALHLFPRRIREKVLYKLKRAYARIRRNYKHIKRYNYD